jgi:tetratricopeptide (TPR) repeat protein
MADYEKHTHRMSDYISLLSHNEDPVAAAQEGFGDLKQLQSQLGDYIRNGNYKEFVLSSAAAPIDESGYEVTVLHQTEAEAIRADVLAYVGRGSEARSLADEILKQDPKNAQAYSTLGYLALKAGNSEEAQKWYGEAVKSNSTDFLSYYHYATLLLQNSGSADGDDIESSLRTAIKLNPRFAPAYDRLGVYLSRQHENLDEARLTCLQAIQLDPGNAIFRANAANILIEMDRYAAALSVLQIATKLAKNPRETEFIQDQIAQAERLEKAHDEAEAYRSAPAVQQATARQSVVNIVPKHPTVSTNGPRRSATGIVRNVVCSYPMILEFKLEIGAGKTIALYNNEMQKIDVTAAGFTPKGTMNPCTDFEGIKARAQYVDSPDSTVNGEVIALELRK